MSIYHVKVTTASAIGLVTTIVGGIVAVVPSLAPDKRIIIAALTAVIVATGLIVNAVHALAGAHASKPPVTPAPTPLHPVPPAA